MQPCVEAIRIAQARQVPPGPDERLLDGILRPVGIAKHESSGGVQATDRGACERGEGVMIAPLCPFHEVSLHAATGWDATGVAALLSMAAGDWLTVPAESGGGVSS